MKDISQNLTDYYYLILKECIENKGARVQEVYQKLELHEHSGYCVYMQELSLITIERMAANMITVTPHGFATYLLINSQKQANEQALKATKLANKALWISVASFAVSIIFNIVQLLIN